MEPFSSFFRSLPRKGAWRRRLLIAVVAGLAALFSTTVAIGQFSQDFDLACRSNFTAAGGITTSGSFGVISALGLPVVPVQDSSTTPTYSARSSTFAIRAGFLPVYEDGPRLRAAPEKLPEQAFTQRLPILYKVAYFIRFGC